MLDAEYLLRLTEGAEEIAEQLHNEIIRCVVSRIMARIGRGDSFLLSAADKYQLELLEDAGYLASDIQKEIAKRTKLQLREIKAAYEDAGIKAIEYDNAVYEAAGLQPEVLTKSPHLIRLLQSGFESTARTWNNLCRTIADRAQQTFIQECDNAYRLVSSGAVSHTEAVADAINRIAAQGVTIKYPSGHTDTIETATLRCVRTGVAQACSDITMARMDEMEWDIVLTSAHLGARYTDADDYTNHEWWQGKFYSRSGDDPRFPPFDVCGLGDVQGICGANCRHSYGPGDGEHNPFKDFDSEENRQAYDLSQKQRAMERRIRKAKRELMGLKSGIDNAELPQVKEKLQELYDRKALALKRNNERYREFCAENGLKTREQRINVAQFDREQAKAARTAAKRRQDTLDGHGIIKKRIESGEISSKLNPGQQNKHVSGTNEFLRYKESRMQNGKTPQSIVIASPEEVQNLISKHCGTGTVKRTRDGVFMDVEFCDADHVIGKYFSNNQYFDTVRFAIHYGKKGAHIVPVEPKGE